MKVVISIKINTTVLKFLDHFLSCYKDRYFSIKKSKQYFMIHDVCLCVYVYVSAYVRACVRACAHRRNEDPVFRHFHSNL